MLKLLFTIATLLSLIVIVASCQEETIEGGCSNKSDTFLYIADTVVYNDDHYLVHDIDTIPTQDTTLYFDIDGDTKNDFAFWQDTVDTAGYYYYRLKLINLKPQTYSLASRGGNAAQVQPYTIGDKLDESNSWTTEDTIELKTLNVNPLSEYTFLWNEDDTTKTYIAFRKKFCTNAGYKYGWVRFRKNAVVGPSVIQQ